MQVLTTEGSSKLIQLSSYHRNGDGYPQIQNGKLEPVWRFNGSMVQLVLKYEHDQAIHGLHGAFRDSGITLFNETIWALVNVIHGARLSTFPWDVALWDACRRLEKRGSRCIRHGSATNFEALVRWAGAGPDGGGRGFLLGSRAVKFVTARTNVWAEDILDLPTWILWYLQYSHYTVAILGPAHWDVARIR